MEPGPDDIREILRIFAESDLEELLLEVGGTRLVASKRSGSPLVLERSSGTAQPADPSRSDQAGFAQAADQDPTTSPTDAVSVVADPPVPSPHRRVEGLLEIRAPLLGVFYRRPSPDRPPFIEVGDVVTPDRPVCIVDVMKMYTQVSAGVAGRVAEILVADGQLVEHDQVLMLVEPT